MVNMLIESICELIRNGLKIVADAALWVCTAGAFVVSLPLLGLSYVVSRESRSKIREAGLKVQKHWDYNYMEAV